MIIALYIAAAVIMAVRSLYFAWRNRGFRKLWQARSSSSGTLFYFYLAVLYKKKFQSPGLQSPR
jgi:hypothetical protein